ncbi:MAG: prepilin-type N-terminal cleavage/methylation domain-containing protein [bacterium]|nr:prepilin-type N-terminal cleavage/methylation domain-containing protein [bacterium]
MNKKGLTLVELLVTLVILGIVITSAISLQLHNQRLYKRETSLIDLRTNVRGALDIMVEDLRSAGFNPEEAAAPAFTPGVVDAQSNLIWIRTDADTDGVYDIGEEIGYSISGGNLYKNTNMNGVTDTAIIARGVDYLEFRYMDDKSVEFTRPVATASLDSIKTIKIIIIGKTLKRFLNYTESGNYPDGTSYSDRCYRCWDSTFVKLRNL